MTIAHKAAYHLLSTFYARRSMNEHIKMNITEDIFNASLIFAKTQEDYDYLETMVNARDELDKEMFLFMNPNQLPIILFKNKDLTLLEFAILHKQTVIHKSHFDEVVYSSAINAGMKESEAKKQCKLFDKWVNLFEVAQVQIPDEAAVENLLNDEEE